MKRRLLAAALGAAALTAGVVGLTTGPAQAVTAVDLVGNFAGDARDEAFLYVAGDTPDLMVSFSGSATSRPTWTTYDYTVSGTYRPIAGNFDGDAFDEILWYAPGSAQDYIWNFTSLSAYTTRPYTVNGTYTPVAGDFTGDGTDDIVWYVPGTGQDFIWDYVADGTYTSTPFTISGRYTPVAGSFGTNATDDILWYSPGSAGDFVWDFTPGGTTYTSRALTINGTFRPIVLDKYNHGWGGEDIFWYAPGTASDFLWNFSGGTYTSTADPVSGTYYSTIAGDFLNDTYEDILWFGDTSEVFWNHRLSGSTVVKTVWTWP